MEPRLDQLPPQSRPGLNPRLLVVEDDPQVRTLLRILLEGQGFGVILARDGRQALDVLAQEELSQRSVDLVMLDLHMPEMDGRECLRRLEGLGCRVPVLLLSGDPVEELEEEFRARVEALVQKPVGMQALLGCVRQVLARPGQARANKT